MLDLAKLNANQRRAVEWGDGPLLVLAGPGSGKTLVLTMRVARLIEESPDARFRVLGLTFTTKAADEMRTRVENILNAGGHRVRLTTFHSFCAEVLRQHGSHLGLKPDFEILNQDVDRVRVLDEAIAAAAPPDAPPITGAGIVKMIDFLLREGFDGKAETPLPFSESDRDWVRPIFDEYVRRLLGSNHLDFGSLLVCCLRLFQEQPRIAKHYRTVYPYICVDEYQDTNKSQDLVLRFLCGNGTPNLFVVADDDQIIYQWNGASPERLQSLREDFSMEVVQLPESYRCPPPVIELANNLIQHNLQRSPDKSALIAASDACSDDAVRLLRFEDHQQEMAWLASDIATRGVDPGTCAVLGRNAKLLQAAAAALDAAGMPAYVVHRKDEFESAPLRFVHAALRLANAPRDAEQLRHLCKSFFELTDLDIRTEQVEAESALHGGALLRGFIGVTLAATPSDAAWRALLDALNDQLAERLRYGEFVKAAFDWFAERRQELGGSDEDHAEEIGEIGVWNDLRRLVRQHFGDDPTLSQFLQELDLRQKTSPPKADEVQCLTIHLAKGKEFNHIYLVGLAEDQLPSFYAKKKGSHSREIEEERRNCFVAITRVQSSLTLMLAQSYFGWDKAPSRFLREMGLDVNQVEVQEA